MRGAALALVGGLLAATAAPAQPAQTPSSTPEYDARVRESFAAAEAFHGPLDGGWTLTAKGEGPLYAFQFAEKDGQLEAAWRDLRRTGALEASGFVEAAERQGGRLVLRFTPAAGVQSVARLRARGGAWVGELDENGRKRAVRLSKTGP